MTSAYLLSVLGFASGLMLAVVLGEMEVTGLFPLIQDGASVVGVLIVVFAFLRAQQNARLAFERTLGLMISKQMEVSNRYLDAGTETVKAIQAVETVLRTHWPASGTAKPTMSMPVDPKLPAPDFPLPREHD